MLESMSDLLTTGEAARMLEVSESTIRLWDRNGRLSARRTAGGQRVFDATVVQVGCAPTGSPEGVLCGCIATM